MTQTFDAARQATRTQDAANAQIYANYSYDGDGLQAKFDQKRADGTTDVRYRIYSSVLGGLLTDISSTGQKVETRVYRFVYGQDSVRQVKAYSVPNGGNPPFNYPDVVVFEGSDPHGTRASVWDHDTNTNKTLSLAAPGAYVEDINWQGLKDRFVSNIGSQYSYGQQSASQYLSSYFSMVDPRNPGTGCSLDGVNTGCGKLFRELQNGGLKSVIFSTTGIGGGDTGVLAGAFTLAAGQASSTRQSSGQRRIAGEGQSQSLVLENGTRIRFGTWNDAPRFVDAFDNFWGIGGTGGQQGSGQQNPPQGPTDRASELLRQRDCANFIAELISLTASLAKDGSRITPSFGPLGDLVLGITPSYDQYYGLNEYQRAISEGRVTASGNSGQSGNVTTYGTTTNYRTISWNREFYSLGRDDAARHIIHESLHLIPNFSDFALAGAASIIATRSRSNPGDAGNFANQSAASQYLNQQIAPHCH